MNDPILESFGDWLTALVIILDGDRQEDVSLLVGLDIDAPVDFEHHRLEVPASVARILNAGPPGCIGPVRS